MVGESGRVHAVEVHPDFVDFAKHNIATSNPSLAHIVEFHVTMADGGLGLPELGPYDAIHVGASCAALPMELVGQLRPGGRMVINVGSELLCVTRTEAEDKAEYTAACVYAGVKMTPLHS
jgi:protein-L-isoaspartate(D-aspartate) O-methyltransferase